MIKVLALALVAVSTAHAQDALTDIRAPSPSSAYLQDGRGVVARSGTGMCWRSGSWTPADAVPGCDGGLAPPIANPIAPPLAAAQPAPATPPAAPAPVPCDFSYTLGGEQAFAFGRATISAAGRQQLDRELIPRLAQCGTIDSVVITGHTDRLGKRDANQRLSERRAAAVESYLKSRGISARIEARGAAAGEPVAECKGSLPAPKLRACLAPNRRVVIDVRGTSK